MTDGVARAMADEYQDFLDEYMSGSAQMIEAAERGYLLDPGHSLPGGSFPPSVIQSILRTSIGFNPETAYPPGCFPRAWPFVGGKLPPPPPRPPTRDLVIEQVGEKLEVVWRGEIPTVHVPRRKDSGLSIGTTACDQSVPLQEAPIARGDPVVRESL